MKRIARKTLIVSYFVFLAGIGVVLGCYIHGSRSNQGTLMSGVAFVRELPYGEKIVGWIETTKFNWDEKRALAKFKKDNPVIAIDPKVKAEQDRLFGK